MLKYRLITGPLLIVALLAIIWFDSWLDTVRFGGLFQKIFIGKDHFPKGLALFGVAMIASIFGALELTRIYRANGIVTCRWLSCLAAAAGVVLTYSIPMGTETVYVTATVSTGMILLFVASLLIFSRHQNVEGIVAAAGAVMFTMVYMGFMLGFLLALRRSHSAWWIVGVILTTKSCDIGAYFTGRALGRHKLIPWLSPGKTWEGLLGGIVMATLVGLLLARASHMLAVPIDGVPIDVVPLWLGALCGAVFAVVGQAGDLAMSLLKRGASIKDSSRLLPGLGGILDVLDSPLMVAPVAFWMLELLPSGP